MASGGGEVDTPCGEELDMASCGGVPVKFHPNKCCFPGGSLVPEKMKGEPYYC